MYLSNITLINNLIFNILKMTQIRKMFVFKPITDEATTQGYVLVTDGADETAAHMEIGYFNSLTARWVTRAGVNLTFVPTMYSLLPQIPTIGERI